ncbi:MAG TPA: dockerin type I domain-containing protein [Gemmataceae bacterium]|jgi:hypothetical protein|nr:dockerin type I domain-containing protein [Gemmataceae bacterium]
MPRRCALRFETFEDRIQPAVAILPSNASGNGYAALDFNSSGGYVPPDTSGAAGPNAYIETVNQEVALYGNKSTGGSPQLDSLDHFWRTVGGLPHISGSAFFSDPIVVYDEKISRFIIGDQDVDFTNHVSNFDIAVSKSNNPTTLTTADWRFYTVTTTQANFDADYPGNFGYNADAFVFTLNMFPVSTGAHVQVVSVNAADLLAGVTQANLHTFSNNVSSFSLRPATMHDAVAGDPMWLVGQGGTNSINVFKMTNVLSNSATITGTGIGVTAYSGANSPLNPNGTTVTTNIDSRIQRAAVSGGHLVAAHAVGNGSTENDIQWYDFNVTGATPTLFQQGRVSGGNKVYLEYPAIDINAAGQIGLTYMRVGNDTGTDFMSMYVTGRNPSNAAGTMQTPLLVPAGTGVANYDDFASGGRAGDLAGINVDPVNGTFWAVNEFANTEPSANWGTAVANFALPPIVSGGVTSAVANTTYGVSSVIPITVTFNTPVTVSTVGGTPSLALNAGGGASAVFASGSGTNVLTFNYTVVAGQTSADLDYTSTSALTLNGGTIKDSATALAADLTLASPGATGSLGNSKNIVIDTGVPTVTNVTSTTANGAYGAGAVVAITITFSTSVAVTGTPLLALNSGGTASYFSGTGTPALTFSYTVVAGDTTGGAHLDYPSTGALTLNGGTIKNSSNGSNATLTLPSPGGVGSLGANKNIVIDTTVPAVSNVTSTTANGTYGKGTVIPITIAFTKAVDVTGTPLLTLNSGGTASYASGSGTTTLTFNYTVGVGDTTNGLHLDFTTTTALTLNSGTILDHLTSVNAVLTLPSPGAAGSLGANKSIIIDAVPALATNITSTNADGTYGFGQTITIKVTFSHSVAVTGTPLLALNSSATASASYVSGTGTNTITFTFTVGLTDVAADLDYASIGALTLNGGTITDQFNSVPANLTLPAPGSALSLGGNKNLVIDGTPAKPSNITSAVADGTYHITNVIPITMTFTKPVVVSTTFGVPTLALNSGGLATYTGGNGTFTTLTFSYTIAAGQNSADLDYSSISALALNGGSIKDQASNTAATLTLPAPSTAGSLSANKDILVDTIGPAVVSYKVLFGSKSYDLVGSGRFDVPWTVTGIQVVFNRAVASGNIHSLSGLTATSLTGLGTSTLTFKFAAIIKGQFNTSLVSTGADALKDAAGNTIVAFSHALNVLNGDFNDDHKVDLADENGVRAAVPAPFSINPPYNIFADMNGDGSINLTDVGIVHKRRGTTLP